MGDYYFGDESNAEEQRLRALEVSFDPASRGVLRELGVGPGWDCWEVGAGHGSIARWLSGMVGPDGRVLATDLDTRFLENGPNLEVRRHDVVEDDLPGDGFDLIHSRFLLEHLDDPGSVVSRLVTALRPGGWLVVEDAAGLGLVIDPDPGVVLEVCEAWESAAGSIGWDPAYGRNLVTTLTQSGLTGVQGVVYRREGRAAVGDDRTRAGASSRFDRRGRSESGITRPDARCVERCLLHRHRGADGSGLGLEALAL